MKAGIVGYGRFGKLFVDIFSKYFHFEIYDKTFKLNENEKATLFKNFTGCEFIFFAVPISQLEQSASEIAPYIDHHPLIADLCSVKEYPINILTKIFPNNEILGIHPLFGPESVKVDLNNHQIVLVKENIPSPKTQKLEHIFREESLKIIEMSAEEHDRQMAWTLCLTQFIGRGLKLLPLSKKQIGTKGYFDLLDIVNRANADTEELFIDMNNYNRFSEEMRKQVIREFTKLNQMLEKEDFSE
ncbi:MAG: prephenate dehydrogenase/arogenate dehydrogenase family protein [Bacteroidetes bacterium]|nr:prephenate dehydrogenase/arogenate dehydrogenase family protein [Bacteroidota bacterium]MBU2585551.1 prephenate dehydrogenase/arogenate dehydrogenase family protein [Bacteroidota bacterium]